MFRGFYDHKHTSRQTTDKKSSKEKVDKKYENCKIVIKTVKTIDLNKTHKKQTYLQHTNS